MGDLLREERQDRVWEPARRTHRGRPTLVDDPSSTTGEKLVVVQVMPTKADQGNRRMERKIFRVGVPGKVLAPGRAIIDMVLGDPVEGYQRMTPLFRHPRFGGEVSKGCFERWWTLALKRVGLKELTFGMHGLRIGGCTAMTELAGLDVAVASIGWATRQMGERYAHRTDAQRALLQTQMARMWGEVLAPESQPMWRE